MDFFNTDGNMSAIVIILLHYVVCKSCLAGSTTQWQVCMIMTIHSF